MLNRGKRGIRGRARNRLKAGLQTLTPGGTGRAASGLIDQPLSLLCGIPEESLVQAARWFAGVEGASRKTTLSMYCQGLNQSSSGTMKNAAIVNLHLATGQIKKRVVAFPDDFDSNLECGLLLLRKGDLQKAQTEHQVEAKLG